MRKPNPIVFIYLSFLRNLQCSSQSSHGEIACIIPGLQCNCIVTSGALFFFFCVLIISDFDPKAEVSDSFFKGVKFMFFSQVIFQLKAKSYLLSTVTNMGQ